MIFYKVHPLGVGRDVTVELNTTYIIQVYDPDPIGPNVGIAMEGMPADRMYWIPREEYDAGIAKHIAFMSGREVDG